MENVLAMSGREQLKACLRNSSMQVGKVSGFMKRNKALTDKILEYANVTLVRTRPNGVH